VGPANGCSFQGREHFFAVAAEAMRRILVDSARRRRAQKRGGNGRRVELADIDAAVTGPDEDLLALDDALEKLEQLDPRRALLVKLRYFAGYTIAEAAAAPGYSTTTAEKEWKFARSWLKVQIAGKA
jgi:RNA polymerase sigma factor (TIGR02999 family)